MIKLKAYAKINLVLNVLSKREDGFHEVDFLMACVDLYDDVYIEKSDIDQVIMNYDVNMNDNLAYKAFLLIKERYKLNGGIKISIDKKIPVSAGMAGGSSNAACVIRGVNELYNLNMSRDQMLEIGSKIGSDVAFCIVSRLSRATNLGEKITIIDQKIKKDNVIVINPSVELSTQKVYQNHKITHYHQDVKQVINNLDNYKDYLHNDLTRSAISLEPKIVDIFRFLDDYNIKYILSGSGPTVIAFTSDDNIANKLYNDAIIKYPKTFKTRILQ